MTTQTEIPRWDHSVRPADLPFDPERLQWVLGKVQKWHPYVDGALLDDVAAVIDNYTPGENEIDESALRLRGHLMRLMSFAVVDQVVERDKRVEELVTRACRERWDELPGDHRSAVGHVRRMAWTLNELVEHLVANQSLKEAP
ncbi:DUF6415 family natural product biosynthesis protein [Streptomyces avermitilis]|uniref:DUF6415 family natural product biosynthesis protein n=1 Tax=Streptomyces avermitilis TaxID=33903 RepID=UPI0033C7E9D4